MKILSFKFYNMRMLKESNPLRRGDYNLINISSY